MTDIKQRFELGARFPDGYYDNLMKRRIAKHYRRRCDVCKYEWPTKEIPLQHSWVGGRAVNCPVHKGIRGKCINTIPPWIAANAKQFSIGLMRVYALGGIYRRRECRIKTCLNKLGRRTRWTTGEFDPTGVVVEDISLCPRCDGKSKITRDTLYAAH